MSRRRKKQRRALEGAAPEGVILFKDLHYPDVVCIKVGFKEKPKDGTWAAVQRDLQQRFRANFPVAMRKKVDGEKYADVYKEVWAFVGTRNPAKSLRTGKVIGGNE